MDHETPFEQAKRIESKARAIVDQQELLIAEMRRRGVDQPCLDRAEDLLAEYHNAHMLARQRLTREPRQPSTWNAKLRMRNR